MRIINMRTMPKFSLSINSFPRHRRLTHLPEHLGGGPIDGGRLVVTDLNHIGYKSTVRCWGPFWVRKNYWTFSETYNEHMFLGNVSVLNNIEIGPPKWVCKLFKWDTNI